MRSNKYLREILWETRNLGIKSFAIDDDFIHSPDISALQNEIRRNVHMFDSIFIQARINKADMSVAILLESLGFYFVEMALVPYSVLKKNEALNDFLMDKRKFLPSRYDLDSLTVRLVDKNDSNLRKIVKAIAEESFTDDRFHLDQNCKKEIADRRYLYWVEDMLNDKVTSISLLELSGRAIAFMARKECSLLLAGFSKQYVKSGLGDFLWLSVLEQMLRGGLAQAETMISANNTAVLNLYARIGFKFKAPAATFHYWSNPSGMNSPD